MTAFGFLVMVIAAVMAAYESNQKREPFPGIAMLFFLGFSLMVLGVTVFLWRHMP
jgi:uncharacterized membrane protein